MTGRPVVLSLRNVLSPTFPCMSNRPHGLARFAPLLQRNSQKNRPHWLACFCSFSARKRNIFALLKSLLTVRSLTPNTSAASLNVRPPKKCSSSPNRVEERQLHHLVGRLALARGDAEVALESLKQALELLPPRGVEFHPHIMPDHVPVWFALGEAELAAGNSLAALHWFYKVAESGAEHIEFPFHWVRSLYFLGHIHLQRGEIETARRRFERFLEFWRHADLDRDRVREAMEAVAQPL